MYTLNGFTFNYVGDLVGEPEGYTLDELKDVHYALTQDREYISASRIQHLINTFIVRGSTMETVTLSYIMQAIIANEYGDIRSILDEVCPNPNADEFHVLTALLTSVKGADFYNDLDGDGWQYDEEV
jgi:hypothetical protein